MYTLIRCYAAMAVLVLCVAVHAQTSGTGKIAGSVSAAGKPVVGALVVLNIQPGANVKPFYAQTVTAGDGTFSFTQVPTGTFRVCPQAPNTNLLAPCTWNLSPATVTLTDGQSVQMQPIQMTQGVFMLLRVNDPTGIAASSVGATAGASLFLGVRTGSMMVQPAPLLAKDAQGEDHGMYVPANAAMEVSVYSSYFSVADSTGKAIDPKNGGLFTVQSPAASQTAGSTTGTQTAQPSAGSTAPSATFQVTGKH